MLYLPFGAFSGFVTIALTFLATEHGLSIGEGALLGGASMLTQWMKWVWAPAVDVTLSPRAWYVISTAASALAVFAMAALPLGPSTLGALLAIIAIGSLINSVVGMAVEAMISNITQPSEAGRVSAWFQAGNLGANALGGALGLTLMIHLPKPWMAGAVMAALFMACCGALALVPRIEAQHRAAGGALAAMKGVIGDLKRMLKTRGGLLAALLCVMPVGTGAAQGVLTQAKVAAHWGAGATQVALVQGVYAGLVTMVGCFGGGWLCDRFHPRTAYLGIGILLGVIATAMALTPPTVAAYIGFNLAYAFGVGLAWSAFTAVVLDAMGPGSGATKYNVYASLSNFPIWWLGLLLGVVAGHYGASDMLLTEAALGVVGVFTFATLGARIRRSPRLASEVA